MADLTPIFGAKGFDPSEYVPPPAFDPYAAIHKFTAHLESIGALISGLAIADGQIHRANHQDDKRGSKNFWYALHQTERFVAGSFGSWKNPDLNGMWSSVDLESNRLSQVERDAIRFQIEELRRKKDEEQKAEQDRVAIEAQRELANLPDEDGSSVYIQKKGVGAIPGVKRWGTSIAAPLRNANGDLRSYQLIGTDGTKWFKPGAQKKGCFFAYQNDREFTTAKTVLIGEGLATVKCARDVMGVPSVAAMDAGNLLPVALEMRRLAPDAKFVFLADNDIDPVEPNTGVNAAMKAAQAVNGVVAVPKMDGRKVDFWDLWHERGADAVRDAIEKAIHPERAQESQTRSNTDIPPIDKSIFDDDQLNLLSAVRSIPAAAWQGKHSAERVIGYGLNHRESGIDRKVGRAIAQEWDRTTGGNATQVFDDSDPDYDATRPVTSASIYKLARDNGWDGTIPWGDPQPLIAKIEPLEYPLDALPSGIREAVEEVGSFVKAPVAMVASSALGAVSIAAQPHVDIKRAEKLTGPVSTFSLTIAPSGERKSTVDAIFTSATKQFETEQAELAEPKLKEYSAELSAWNAEREGMLSAIKHAGREGKNSTKMKDDLKRLEQEEPEKPRVPKLILMDETPENLAYTLAKKWPSAGVVSSEAGVVFGAHGMGYDSVMRNLALLNVLWDGGSLTIGRKTSESFTVKDVRLTVALQIQDKTLQKFFEKTGELARGTGFLARFLISWPESTQGYRLFTEPPKVWPKLAVFDRRISEILNMSMPLNQHGTLEPVMLDFTPAAKMAWIEFHDTVESELKVGGELYDVRDVAAKIADNAARIAALFQFFEHGISPVGVDAFDSASRIALWHLSESRRFFGELALPTEVSDAVRLDDWLIDYAKRERVKEIGRRFVLQNGPLRTEKTLGPALKYLDELGRTRSSRDGKKKLIEVNPVLLDRGTE